MIVGRRKLTEEDFHRALDEVLGPEDEVFIVFSGIYTFAHLFEWPPQDTPDRLLDVFESFASNGRTLVVPAYYLGFAGTRLFDPRRTLTDIGMLPDCAVQREKLNRLDKPMNSYMVAGAKAEEILRLPCTTAWGEDGVMAWLVRNKAKVMTLGVPWHESCSLYHYAEELLKVPYRYHKRFVGELRRDGVPSGTCEEVMFSRSAKVPVEWDHEKVYPRLLDANVVVPGGYGGIPLEAALASDIAAVTCDMLDANPYAYVTNYDEVKAWVDHEKEIEMSSLTDEETFKG